MRLRQALGRGLSRAASTNLKNEDPKVRHTAGLDVRTDTVNVRLDRTHGCEKLDFLDPRPILRRSNHRTFAQRCADPLRAKATLVRPCKIAMWRNCGTRSRANVPGAPVRV